MGYNRSFKEKLFKDVFEKYFNNVSCYIYGYCKDRDMAQSITHDVFITFWENADNINLEKTVLPYLYFIAKNKTINVLRRNVIEGKYTNYVIKREQDIRARALESSTLEKVHEAELEKIISLSIDEMNEKVKKIFCLSRFDHLTNSQIAKELNISEKTVEYRMASALRLLRKNLKDYLNQ